MNFFFAGFYQISFEISDSILKCRLIYSILYYMRKLHATITFIENKYNFDVVRIIFVIA